VHDFVIIGAGIVGLATARELRKRHPRARIAILEKEKRPGLHASGRNSGVLHSGIYYGSDTLKARVCATGAARMRAFAAEQDIPCQPTGKVIIATREEELPSIDRLLKNAQENHIRAERLDEAGVKELEPHAGPFQAGIYSPDTAVIDSLAVVYRLCELLAADGVEILYQQGAATVAAGEKVVLTEGGGRHPYGHLFNCAGAHADVIARQVGLCRDYALLPFKGIYYKLAPERRDLVRSNIYPVPDLHLPFLGVHFTRVIGGEAYVGPTAIPALGRENYGLLRGIRWREGGGIAWRLLRMYLRDRHGFRHLVKTEVRKYWKPLFLQAARRLVPALESRDLLRCNKVGIRPQLVNIREDRLEMDYIIETSESSTHVLNAISPAFTGAFAFAELIVDRFEQAAGASASASASAGTRRSAQA
jgi:(S)-2-hydroxyglutarate dehydrogenase